MPGYYDREGNPIDMFRWGMLLADDAYKRVAGDTIGDIAVSTVWLGLDHNFLDDGPALVFESMVFGGAMDGQMIRYATEADARDGHAHLVTCVAQAAELLPEPAEVDEAEAGKDADV